MTIYKPNVFNIIYKACFKKQESDAIHLFNYNIIDKLNYLIIFIPVSIGSLVMEYK